MRVAVSAAAISSGSSPVAVDSSDRVGSRPSWTLNRSLARQDSSGPLLYCAADLHHPVIPEETTDFSGDLGHGIGGKLGAIVRVKAPHRL